MISAEKGQDHWIFVITVEWISLAQALRVKAMTIVANNSSSLKELCHEIQPNGPLALRGHVTNASFKQLVGISLMAEIDRAHRNYLTPEI